MLSTMPSPRVVLLGTFIVCVGGDLYHEIDRLIGNMQNNYNLNVPPIKSALEPLILRLAFEIGAIREFDEASEKFSVIGTLYLGWKDERMTWDPLDYGNVSNIVTHNKNFWTPAIMLTNAFEEYKKVGEDEYWPIRFLSNRDAIYYPGSVFTAVCVPNLKHYPWDKQECTLDFQVYGYFPQEIKLEPSSNRVFETGFKEHGTWKLIGSNVFLKPDNITMSIALELQRKPEFLVVNVLLPIIFMSYLNVLVFLMPTKGGERISYSITVLLAIAVFLTIIADNMPKSARSIPYLIYYLMAVLIMSIAIILMLTFGLRMFYRPNTHIPAFWAWLGRFSLCKASKKSASERYDSTNHEEQNTGFELSEETHGYTELSVEQGTSTVEETAEILVTWMDVSNSLDWVFFVTCFVAITVCTVLFIAYAANN